MFLAGRGAGYVDAAGGTLLMQEVLHVDSCLLVGALAIVNFPNVPSTDSSPWEEIANDEQEYNGNLRLEIASLCGQGVCVSDLASFLNA